jgi:hypothetical protein
MSQSLPPHDLRRLQKNQRLRSYFLAAWGSQCAYCGAPLQADISGLELGGMNLDHIAPRQTGGSDAVENFCPTCRPCNTRKWWRRLPPDREAALLRRAAEVAAFMAPALGRELAEGYVDAVVRDMPMRVEEKRAEEIARLITEYFSVTEETMRASAEAATAKLECERLAGQIAATKAHLERAAAEIRCYQAREQAALCQARPWWRRWLGRGKAGS